LAVELTWALGAAASPEHRRQHPALEQLYEASPELRHEVATFWAGANHCQGPCFEELAILAHHGGLLFSLDPQVLFSQMDQLCATAPVELRLASEFEAERAALLSRLRHLRSSAEMRGRYVAMVSKVWAGVDDAWQRHGRLAVNNEVSARVSALAGGASWYEVAGHNRWGHALANLVNELPPDGELAIVPAFFNRRGLFLDLPGVVLLGVPADATGPRARQRTEVLARRLKAISDPTRLAMLNALQLSPLNVTELARSFSLAQPTVSNHVRLLRDAGLVTNATDGDRRRLAVHDNAVTELLAHLQGVLGPQQ
jgi:DNA-binding transcriptional ArsR family regulator